MDQDKSIFGDNFKMKFEEAFLNFAANFQLSALQQEQFRRYLDLLLQENEKFNLTARRDPVDVVYDHFSDSLALTQFIDLKTERRLCDIGSGAGFPAIPLKIFVPELPILILEVNQKKIMFLDNVQKQLGLTDIILSSLDWRTFLRKAEIDVTLFVARASVHTEELLRVFKPSSTYKDARLIYYASEQWTPTEKEKEYIAKRVSYQIRDKKRSLVFFIASISPDTKEYS